MKSTAATAAQNGAETKQLSQEIINQLVDATNESKKNFGFIGEEITKLQDTDGGQRAMIQDKLEEVKTYLFAMKEALEAQYGTGRGGAVVKSSMELES